MNLSVSLPGKAPAAIVTTNVNFAARRKRGDHRRRCNLHRHCRGTDGTSWQGLHLSVGGIGPVISSLQGFQANNLGDQAFYIAWVAAAGFTNTSFVTWAYTAP